MEYFLFLFSKGAVALSLALSLFPASACGRLSLGHAGIMALGAYAFGGLCLFLPPVTAALAAAMFAGAVGFLIGFLSAHLSSDYFGAVTLALGEMVRIALSNFSPMGGAAGFVMTSRLPQPASAVLGLAICGVGCVILSRSRLGLLCRATRDDETAAFSLGVNTHLLKAGVFALSCVLAGVCGVVYASLTGFLTPNDFNFLRSYECLSAVILGGGSVGGTVLAALGLEIFSDLTQGVGEIKMIGYGIILILISQRGGAHERAFFRGAVKKFRRRASGR